jgi:hypothetical protein
MLLALQGSGSRKLLWGHFGLFGGNHWNWFSAPRDDYWGWSSEPQQDSRQEQEQQASPASPSPAPVQSPSPSPAPAKDSKVKSEQVGAPAGSTEQQSGKSNSDNNNNGHDNSSGDKSSEGSDEPAAQAQGVGYKLPDGDILIHTQAQVRRSTATSFETAEGSPHIVTVTAHCLQAAACSAMVTCRQQTGHRMQGAPHAYDTQLLLKSTQCVPLLPCPVAQHL